LFLSFVLSGFSITISSYAFIVPTSQLQKVIDDVTNRVTQRAGANLIDSIPNI